MTVPRPDLEQALKLALARELKAIMDGWSQVGAAGMLGVRQQDLTRLWSGRVAGFSASRLLRLIASQHYTFELHIRPIRKPFARPRELPTVRIIRYDRYGRVVAP